MTRGQRRILDELASEYFDKFVSVPKLAKVLGYTKKFVDRTILELYWKPPPRGFSLVRMRKGKTWFFRMTVDMEGDR